MFLLLSTMTVEQKRAFALYFSVPFVSITIAAIASQVISFGLIDIVGFWYRGWLIVSTLVASLIFYWRTKK